MKCDTQIQLCVVSIVAVCSYS